MSPSARFRLNTHLAAKETQLVAESGQAKTPLPGFVLIFIDSVALRQRSDIDPPPIIVYFNPKIGAESLQHNHSLVDPGMFDSIKKQFTHTTE